MNVIGTVISATIGYSLGCIQTAFLLGKIFKKIDIREHGSHNAGASNAVMIMGWKFGVVTGLVDILKAVAAVLIVKWLYPGQTSLVFMAGACAILGHNFPFYMRFRGGKGTASLLGMMIAVDWQIGLIMLAVISTVALITDFIAVGTFATVTLMPFLLYLYDFSTLTIAIAVSLAVLSFYKHRCNIVRLVNGSGETRISEAMDRRAT